MKLFVDTNVIMDFLSERQPFFENAKKIMELSEHDGYELYISSLSFTTLFYVLRKQKTPDEVLQLLENIQEVMSVVPVDKDIINFAIHSGFSDFEDAVQYYCAVTCNAERIITRDKTGFAKSSIPVIDPAKY